MKLTWHRDTDDAHDGTFYTCHADELSGMVWYDGYTGWHWETTLEDIRTGSGTARTMTDARRDAESVLAASGVSFPERHARRVGMWHR